MIERVNTKVTGTNSGPDAKMRQQVLSELSQRMYPPGQPARDLGLELELIPEPDNPYDPDAIQVFLPEFDAFGCVQLGYVSNSRTVCDLCNYVHSRFPVASGRCVRCGDCDHLRRDGTASFISALMRKDPNVQFYAVLQSVTGGVGDKSFGANIEILRRK